MAAVLAAFPEESHKLTEARARLRARALEQLAYTEALLAQWAEEDATDDPEELRRRDEEALELRRAMNETRRLNGERLHFPELEEVETFEGVWEEVVGAHATALAGHRVRVLLLPDAPLPSVAEPLLRSGMFASSLPSIDLDDFKIAEYSGEDDSVSE